jgi:hypothetical protein
MQAALSRLRAYVSPSTAWSSVPLSRRAAVLILLFADRKGDLRVVITMRSSTLKSCNYPRFPVSSTPRNLEKEVPSMRIPTKSVC